jgi:site-specific recombinase XerD
MVDYSAHFILWKYSGPNTKGQFPIYFQFIVEGKAAYKSTGYKIKESQWDASKEEVILHKLKKTINEDLSFRKNQVAVVANMLNFQKKVFSAKDLKNSLKQIVVVEKKTNIFEFTTKFSKEVEHKRTPGTLVNYTKHLLRLELFYGNKDLNFEDITAEFLYAYETHLRKTVNNNYIHALFKTLKSIFNAAIKRGLITNYPFKVYENPVYKTPVKDYLSLEQVQTIFNKLNDLKGNDKVVAVYLLLGCYTGLRISDWYKFNSKAHVDETKVKIQAHKNNEWVFIPLTQSLKQIIALTELYPLTLAEPVINRHLKNVNKHFKWDKRITSHTGRHTFAITMCADRGISSETCAKLMGITIKTCVENYYSVTQHKIDTEIINSWKGL